VAAVATIFAKDLIFAAAGDNLSQQDAQMGLLEAFSAIHLKGFKRFVPYPAYRGAKALPDTTARLSIGKSCSHSMLLLSPVNSSECTVKPGNLYLGV